MQAQIRHAGPEDAAHASQLAWRAKSSWGYTDEWLELWREALTITAEHLRAHESLVAISGDQIVGVCILESHSDRGSLEHVWVAPEYQGRGIGRALVQRALDKAALLGLATVEVASDPFAETFYLRLGARRLRVMFAPMPGAPERTLPVLEFVLGSGLSAQPANKPLNPTSGAPNAS